MLEKMPLTGRVLSVSKSAEYTFTKPTLDEITLIQGLGVDGDVHSGKTVKHRSRIARDPSKPNLRQVHVIHSELFDELSEKGFQVTPGLIGENITTQGLDLLSLPLGTILQFESGAEIEVTGLRNPCYQLNDCQPGLMQACLGKDENGDTTFKSGIMAIVLKGGNIRPNETITVILPKTPHQKLKRV